MAEPKQFHFNQAQEIAQAFAEGKVEFRVEYERRHAPALRSAADIADTKFRSKEAQ